MAPGQALLDGVLALEQPVHGVEEVVFVEVREAEDRGQGIGSGGGLEAAGGGELGAGVSETGDDQSHHQIALGTGRTQAAIEADLAQGAEEGGDVAVGLGANDVEGGLEVRDGGALLEQDTKTLDQFGRPLGEVGEGAFLDLAVLAVGLAQEDSRGRFSIGNGFDVHGYSIFSITVIIITNKENMVKILHGYTLRNEFRDKPFQINDLKRKYRSGRLEVQFSPRCPSVN